MGSVEVDFVITVAHPGILPTIVTNEELVHTLTEGPNHITMKIDISYFDSFLISLFLNSTLSFIFPFLPVCGFFPKNIQGVLAVLMPCALSLDLGLV